MKKWVLILILSIFTIAMTGNLKAQVTVRDSVVIYSKNSLLKTFKNHKKRNNLIEMDNNYNDIEWLDDSFDTELVGDSILSFSSIDLPLHSSPVAVIPIPVKGSARMILKIVVLKILAMFF